MCELDKMPVASNTIFMPNDDSSPPPGPRRSDDRLEGLDLKKLMAEGMGPRSHGDGEIELPEIAGFESIRPLGAGGMGVVYLARQVSLDREVAVKVLPSTEGVASQFLDRLEIEAKAMAKVSHPNTVQVFDFVRLPDGGAAVIMEWVDGGNLREKLLSSGEPLSDWREAVRIARDVASSLAVAHEMGIVHRDIKPENVLLADSGTVKVTDFGISRTLEAVEKYTLTGVYLGTPGYMSPEQLGGKEVDSRADIYALGVMLYEMLTGVVPQGNFDPPRKLRSSLPPPLSQLVMECLRSDPEERPGTVEEIASRLERIEHPHRRAVLVGLGVGGLGLAGVGIGAAVFGKKPRFPESRALRGQWMISEEVLRSDDDRAVLALRPEVSIFPSNVKIRFTRLEGIFSVALFFKHPNGWAACELSHGNDFLGGVHLVDGKELREMDLPDMFLLELENGREYEWEVRLREDVITTLVDGQVYQRRDISGASLDVSFHWDWTMLDTEGESLAIGSFMSPAAFHSVVVEPVPES